MSASKEKWRRKLMTRRVRKRSKKVQWQWELIIVKELENIQRIEEFLKTLCLILKKAMKVILSLVTWIFTYKWSKWHLCSFLALRQKQSRKQHLVHRCYVQYWTLLWTPIFNFWNHSKYLQKTETIYSNT